MGGDEYGGGGYEVDEATIAAAMADSSNVAAAEIATEDTGMNGGGEATGATAEDQLNGTGAAESFDGFGDDANGADGADGGDDATE